VYRNESPTLIAFYVDAYGNCCFQIALLAVRVCLSATRRLGMGLFENQAPRSPVHMTYAAFLNIWLNNNELRCDDRPAGAARVGL